VDHVVYINDSQYLGNVDSFHNWAFQEFRYIGNLGTMHYDTKSPIRVQPITRSYVYFMVQYGENDPEKVIMELYDDHCPNTSRNFRELCAGFIRQGKKFTYEGTEFTRIRPNEWVKGGDLK